MGSIDLLRDWLTDRLINWPVEWLTDEWLTYMDSQSFNHFSLDRSIISDAALSSGYKESENSMKLFRSTYKSREYHTMYQCMYAFRYMYANIERWGLWRRLSQMQLLYSPFLISYSMYTTCLNVKRVQQIRCICEITDWINCTAVQFSKIRPWALVRWRNWRESV